MSGRHVGRQTCVYVRQACRQTGMYVRQACRQAALACQLRLPHTHALPILPLYPLAPACLPSLLRLPSPVHISALPLTPPLLTSTRELVLLPVTALVLLAAVGHGMAARAQQHLHARLLQPLTQGAGGQGALAPDNLRGLRLCEGLVGGVGAGSAPTQDSNSVRACEGWGQAQHLRRTQTL